MTEAETETPHIRELSVDRLHEGSTPDGVRTVVFDTKNVHVRYGKALALKDVSMDIYKNHVTAFIGPSGCGKSTFIRCFDRMNDLIESARIEGQILYHGQDLYGTGRRSGRGAEADRHGLPEANPFPKSIYDNIAFGPRVLGMKDGLDERVEHALSGQRCGTR